MVRSKSLTLSRKPAGKPKRDAFATIKSFLLRVFFLLLLVAVVCGVITYRRGGEQLHETTSKILQKQFPSAQTSFRHIALDGDRGIRLLGVEWRQLDAPKHSPALLSVEEVYVECPIKIRTALAGKFSPRRLVIRRPCLRIAPHKVNAIQELCILIPNSDRSSPCETEIVDASVILLGKDNNDFQKISGINASFLPGKEAKELELYEPTNKFEEAETPEDAASRVRISHSSARSAEFTAYNSQVKIRPIDYEEPMETGSQESISTTPTNPNGQWSFEVTVSNPFVESIKVAGQINYLTWSMKGGVHKLDLASLHDLLSDLVALPDSFFKEIQGKTSLDFEVSGNTGTWADLKYKIVGSSLNCGITTPIIKYPLSEIETRYSIDNDSATLEKFTANCGLTSIKAAYRQKGPLFAPTASTLQLKLNDFRLDDELLKRLAVNASQGSSSNHTTATLKFLEDYNFKGTANVAATLERSERTQNEWTPTNLDLICKDVEFTYRHFPYHLDQLAGTISLDADETLTLALSSSGSNSALTLDGQFTNVLTNPRGQVDLVANDRAIDALLLTALPENCQPTITNLHPSGRLDAKLRIVYDPVVFPKKPLQLEMGFDIHDGFIQYDLFPMPISSIDGKIYMRNGAWVFSDLTGKTASGTLMASGSLVNGEQLQKLTEDFRELHAAAPQQLNGAEIIDSTEIEKATSPAPLEIFSVVPIPNSPLADNAARFQLTTDASNFPLGEELRKALVKYKKKDAFEEFNLDGKADGQIRISYRSDTKKLGLEFEMTPVPGAVSARPVKFPFELREINGRFVYREDSITIDGFRAQNGRTALSANIKGRSIPYRGWSLDISNLHVDQLQIDRDLQSATPNQATKLLSFLKATGSFNLDGAIRVSKGSGDQAKTRAAWDLQVTLQQNGARPGVQLDAICGSVKIVGTAIENGLSQVFGYINFDSLYCNDLHLAAFSGPLYFNGRDLFWGREAPTIRRTSLYQDPFLRGRIDLDPVFQQTRPSAPSNLGTGTGNLEKTASAPPSKFRGQAQQSVPAGFEDTPSTQEALVQKKALATTPDGRSPIQAQLFEGALVSDGVLSLGETPTYRFTAALHSGKLEDFSRYFTPGSKPLKGSVNAHASLQGETSSIATLKGEGDMNIKDAELYDLPQIVKIFQLLNVQKPDQTAFNSATAKFNVIGDRLKLTNVLLQGEALTLFGDGWVTLRGQEKLIDLTLNSRLGNASNRIPIVSDVLGEIGDQLTQIRVEGNLKSPVVHQEAAPGVKKAWWSVFPEGEPAPTDKTPVGKVRPLRDAWKKITGDE